MLATRRQLIIRLPIGTKLADPVSLLPGKQVSSKRFLVASSHGYRNEERIEIEPILIERERKISDCESIYISSFKAFSESIERRTSQAGAPCKQHPRTVTLDTFGRCTDCCGSYLDFCLPFLFRNESCPLWLSSLQQYLIDLGTQESKISFSSTKDSDIC